MIKSKRKYQSELKNKMILSGTLLLLPFWVSAVTAQEAPVPDPQATSAGLEELVVTAQKREENIQNVAIAMTAFSGKQLERQGLVESTEIAAMTPGVSISASAGDQSRQFSIRGVTQNDFADHTEAPNAVYIDEGYVSAPQGQVFALFDLERVEILKGPQGTLFGRNATGGLVHYVSRKPTRDFESFVDLTYGSYNQVRIEGAVSGPLTQTLSARLAVMSNRHDNIVHNIYPYGNSINALTGKPFVPSASGQSDFWNDNQVAARGELLWDASPDVSLLLSVFGGSQKVSVGAQFSHATTAVLNANGNQVDSIFSSNDPKGCDAISAETGACLPIFFLNGKLPGPNTSALRPVQGGDLFGYIAPSPSTLTASEDHALDSFNTYHTRGSTAKLKWNFDKLTLNAISNYMYFDKRQTLDTDASPAPQSLVLQTAKNKTFSQEIRLDGDFGAVRWVGGLYYLHIKVNYSQGLAFSPDSPISILFFGGQPAQDPIIVDMTTNSYSAFNQFNFDLTKELTLTAGIRGIKEKKSFSYDNYWFASTMNDQTLLGLENATPLPVPIDPAGGGARYPSFRGSSDNTLWAGKAQLEFRPIKDLLLYAGYSRGVKAGGFNAKLNDFNPAATPAQIPYNPEVLNAYEGGFKSSRLFNGTSRLNGSVYYYDYSGYQAFVFTGTAGLIKNTDATYKGAELQFESQPTDHLNLMVTAAYVDAKIKNLEIAPTIFRDVRPTFTPKLQLSALARYELPVTIKDGSLAVQLDGSYQSSRYFNIRNFQADNMKAYAIANAKLSWSSPDERYMATLFVDNLFDRRYQVGGFDLATLCGCNEEAYGKPRWFGIRFHVSTN